MASIKVGIIGGSGFYSMPELKNPEAKSVDTEFGPPSDQLVVGTIENVPVVVLSRHGQGHRFNPTEVNYRANIRAMQKLGVTHILAGTACGSLREDFAPGDLVLLDSFIDRTTKRKQSFHDQESPAPFGTVCHIPMHPTFCDKTRSVIAQAATESGLGDLFKNKGTVVTIEGPRFSTRAESNLFRSWKCDVINMTTVPEVVLAKELGISYASVAMVTDYDCWKESEEAVDVQKVLAVLSQNVCNVRKLFVHTIKLLGENNWTEVIESNQAIAKSNIMH